MQIHQYDLRTRPKPMGRDSRFNPHDGEELDVVTQFTFWDRYLATEVGSDAAFRQLKRLRESKK